MAFSPTTPTLARVLAAGADANGATITNLGSVGSGVSIGATTHGPGMQYFNGAVLGLQDGAVYSNGAFTTEALNCNGPAVNFPDLATEVGEIGQLWNNEGVVNVG